MESNIKHVYIFSQFQANGTGDSSGLKSLHYHVHSVELQPLFTHIIYVLGKLPVTSFFSPGCIVYVIWAAESYSDLTLSLLDLLQCYTNV